MSLCYARLIIDESRDYRFQGGLYMINTEIELLKIKLDELIEEKASYEQLYLLSKQIDEIVVKTYCETCK